VIAWLTQVKLEELAPSASQAQCRKLNCFAAWVRLGAIFEAETPHLDQLIQLAFQLTTSENAGTLCLACISIYDLYSRRDNSLLLHRHPLQLFACI
jgi:hypothetical protein